MDRTTLDALSVSDVLREVPGSEGPVRVVGVLERDHRGVLSLGACGSRGEPFAEQIGLQFAPGFTSDDWVVQTFDRRQVVAEGRLSREPDDCMVLDGHRVTLHAHRVAKLRDYLAAQVCVEGEE